MVSSSVWELWAEIGGHVYWNIQRVLLQLIGSESTVTGIIPGEIRTTTPPGRLAPNRRVPEFWDSCLHPSPLLHFPFLNWKGMEKLISHFLWRR